MTPTDQLVRPVITWLILVYDRNALERFPFKREWYRFSYNRATDKEAAEVLRLLGWQRPQPASPAPSPSTEWQATYEVSLRHTGTSPEILRFRHLFDRVGDDANAFADSDLGAGLLSVSLPHESYFEDENEKPINLTAVFDSKAQCTSGKNARALVFDQPESVLRFGPASPLRADLWTQKDADLLAQLFDVYRQLCQSRWINSPCVVSPLPDGKCNALLPVEQDCKAVILPFRQLYSKDPIDDLFNRSCNIHNRHCPDSHPAFAWVEHYKRSFNTFLDKPPGFPPLQCQLTGKRYLDAFAYGAGLVHASGKQDAPSEELKALLAAHPRELVVMMYHYILQTLLGYVAMAIPVIHQDALHWTGSLGWTAPGKPNSQTLFG